MEYKTDVWDLSDFNTSINSSIFPIFYTKKKLKLSSESIITDFANLSDTLWLNGFLSVWITFWSS